MTPSINRLADSALALGRYMLDCEFELVREEFARADIDNLSQFKRWVTGYMYYNALVCVCIGGEAEINTRLEADWEELVVWAAATA
ncbi:hypothetical protein EBZ80_27510 [bacterium]|jgi:hypothetical protein|nr:hypothetical protein [bacterium]